MATFVAENKHLEIQLEEIKSVTDNFNENKVVRTSESGKVYVGELSHSKGKSLVSMKRIDRTYWQGELEFYKEVRMVSCYKHENLVSLLGFCTEGDEMVLVYEHASNGSLDQRLNDDTLTWAQRIKICLDAAKGLNFLHDPQGTHQRLLHCDIKSANILLNENLNAKVSNFGLSKMAPIDKQNSFVICDIVGTPVYCDPIYMETYCVTKESDVYSFGVVMFEVLCGRLCVENSNGQLNVLVPMWKESYGQKKLDEIIFEDLKQQMDPSSLDVFADIAFQCLHTSREERPAMSLVVEKLEIALEIQERSEGK